MHVEVTRMITAWLSHPVYGVNALLPDIPRDLIGGTEEDEEPEEMAAVYNDIDYELDDVLGFNPAKRPSLVVISDSNPEGTDLEQPTKEGHVYSVAGAIGYYPRDVSRGRGRRDGNYVLRAVGQSLVRFNQPRLSKDYRELNGIKFVRLTKLSFQRTAGAVPESALLGILFFDGIVVNKLP